MCVQVREGDDPTALEPEPGTLPGGRYLRARLRGEPPEVYERIGPTFATLVKAARPDPPRPSLELCRHRDEIDVPTRRRLASGDGLATGYGICRRSAFARIGAAVVEKDNECERFDHLLTGVSFRTVLIVMRSPRNDLARFFKSLTASISSTSGSARAC